MQITIPCGCAVRVLQILLRQLGYVCFNEDHDFFAAFPDTGSP